MLHEAVEAEVQFAEDLLAGGVAGLSLRDMRQYLGYVADSRLKRLGIAPVFNVKNPFSFMDLQDVQELTNFFERRVSAYQSAVVGEVGFGEDF
jgi:ribonucleoside-diphosphate reductase beta chain